MRNEFIPIRNEFILDKNYGKLLRKAPEWIHSRLEYIHSGSGFFIVRGTFFYSLTLGWLLWTVHTETPVPLCVHTAQLPDRGHVALTHAALRWRRTACTSSAAPSTWRCCWAPRCPTWWLPSGRTLAWPTLSMEQPSPSSWRRNTFNGETIPLTEQWVHTMPLKDNRIKY